jgi:hypothetical protein
MLQEHCIAEQQISKIQYELQTTSAIFSLVKLAGSSNRDCQHCAAMALCNLGTILENMVNIVTRCVDTMFNHNN